MALQIGERTLRTRAQSAPCNAHDIDDLEPDQLDGLLAHKLVTMEHGHGSGSAYPRLTSQGHSSSRLSETFDKALVVTPRTGNPTPRMSGMECGPARNGRTSHI